ncbi:MAG: putative ribonuclease VapC [Parcubacteria group bacterium GW2011_GWC2_44_22]|nr:MAG: putative ribonuclease VapC [Parcubacteria group bacterium GW2011_GWC2_44_22]
MAKFLLDSDVLIWLLRGRAETMRLVDRLHGGTHAALACSALSVLEVWTGVRPGEERRTEALMESLQVVPVDASIARRAAGLLVSRKRQRDPREWIDVLIAATCLELHLTLVTYNARDYPYPDISLYPTSVIS